MLTRITLAIFLAATTAVAYASDVSATCYLDSRWHEESRGDWKPEMVRRIADVRRTFTSPSELAKLRAILRLNRFQSRKPEQDDFCFVADIRHADGTVEAYCAGRFYVMSADYRSGLRIHYTGFRKDIDRFMGVTR